MDAKVQEGNFVAIWDSAVNDFMLEQKPCNLMTVGDIFGNLGYGFGLQKGSHLEPIISSEILRLREMGFLDKMKEKW